jgi:parallel beta-helix repeat protein
MVGFGAMASVTENTISGNICNMPSECGPDPINQGQSVGIFAIEAGDGNKIWNNRLENNDVGIYLYSCSGRCTTDDNKLRDNRFFGFIIQDGDNTVSNNKIFGGIVGIAVVADSVNTIGTLKDNIILET